MSANHIYLFILDGYDKTVSITCMSSLLKLQQIMATMPGCPRVEMVFKKDIFDVFDHLTSAETTENDTIIVMNSRFGIDTNFLLSPIPDALGIVVPAYPVSNPDSTLDWQKIAMAKKSGVHVNELKQHGTMYNFVAREQTCYQNRFIKTDNTTDVFCDIVKFSPSSLNELRQHLHGANKLDIPVWVDITTTSKTSIPYSFSGCVGNQILKLFE